MCDSSLLCRGVSRCSFLLLLVANGWVYQKRVAMYKQRENDPAVLVDLPQTPQAAELEKVGGMGKEG